MDVYNHLKELIISGQFKADERLTEVMLANQLQVSRTPIREALQQLEFDGLVTRLSKGYAVSSFSIQNIQEIYHVRALLEGYAAFEAALHRTDEHIAIMQKANNGYINHINQMIEQPNKAVVEQIVHYNKQFHDAINKASNNLYIKKHIEQVIILPLVYRSFYWYDKYELKRSIEAHETILNAIQSQQPERAKIAVQEHIYKALDRIIEHHHQEEWI